MIFNRLKWVYLVGFFIILALPLLNLPPWFSPPDWGKTIVFRIVLSILIFLFIYQILSSQRHNNFLTAVKNVLYKGKKVFSPFWLLIALLGIFFLATVFSLDRNFSLWGSPYRSGGFVNFAFYIAFAILAFLILEENDWRKIWDFSILIGILVSIIAIFQWLGLFKEIFIPFEGRAPSTIGNPIFLAIYLLLLSFLTLSFGLKEKKYLKKFLYFLSFFFFLFVIVFITVTRAAILGLAVGFIYFLFFYPFRKRSISLILKFSLFIVLIVGIYGIYYINTQPLPEFIQKNKILSGVASRLSIRAALEDPRISGWKVSWQALKARPILGYGPENFSIGFDKFYDPKFPQIAREFFEYAGWWDRAHNFILDISLTAGVPALIIYLALFEILFWQLQKLKYNPNLQIKSECSEYPNTITGHAIQATFLAYLVANFFSFDSFSTYLVSFLLIGYSLHLISSNINQRQTAEETLNNSPKNAEQFSVNQRSALTQRINQRRFSGKTSVKIIYSRIIKWQKPILAFLLIILIWFIWVFNLKPFKINTQINLAESLVENERCDLALEKMEETLPEKSFLDGYLRKKYVEFLLECQLKIPELSLEFRKKGRTLLKEQIEIQPYDTRSWINLAGFTLNLLEEEKNPEIAQGFKNEVNYYLEKANQLSPKRQEVFIAWITADLSTGEYQRAKEKAQKCIDLNERLGDCWWLMGLSNIYLGEEEAAKKNIETARAKGYPISSENSLLKLAKVYVDTKNYQKLLEIYKELIEIKPANPEYYISLAIVYRELGDFENARKEIKKALEMAPELKEEAEEFLKTIR